MTQPDAPAPGGERHEGLVRLAAAGLVVGALAGLLGTAFHLALEGADAMRERVIGGAFAHSGFGWLALAALAAASAALAHWLVRRFAPEASGSGIPQVEAVVRDEVPALRWRVLPVKFVGGVLAIGSGFALGREGPTVHMGATGAQLVARAAGFSSGDTRALIAAGAGADLAAAFNAPLAGVIFVFEELVGGFHLRTTVATLAACGAGLAVMRAIAGDHPVFLVPMVHVDLFPGYLAFLAFGALIGLLGPAYNWMIVACLRAMDRMERIPGEWRAAAVGALVGALAWLAPEAIGSGDRQVQAVLDGGHTAAQLAILFGVRFLLGPLSYAPGLPGGLFAPLLVIGAVGGVLLGTGMQAIVPGMAVPTAAYAAVGMGALFVAVVRAPLTGVALAVEMTGAVGIFVPLLTACTAALAVPAALGSRPIYELLGERDRKKRGISA